MSKGAVIIAARKLTGGTIGKAAPNADEIAVNIRGLAEVRLMNDTQRYRSPDFFRNAFAREVSERSDRVR